MAGGGDRKFEERRAAAERTRGMLADDPWTDPDPQPGDFDAELEAMDPREIQRNVFSPDARVTVLPAGMDEDDVRRLAALAHERGKTIGEVLVELVRAA